jgi:MtN3 and saliva related transmembrane protein
MGYVTVIGLMAGILTTLSFLPQVIKSWKTRKTRDISSIAYSLLTIGIFLWLVYGLLLEDLPLILANGIAFVLASSILLLKIRNG